MTDEPAPAGMVPVVAAAPFPLHLAGEDRAAGWYGMAEAELAHRWAEWGLAIILPAMPREAPLALADLPLPKPEGEPLRDYLARAAWTQPERDRLPSVEDVRARYASAVNRDSDLSWIRELKCRAWPANLNDAVGLGGIYGATHWLKNELNRLWRDHSPNAQLPDAAYAFEGVFGDDEWRRSRWVRRWAERVRSEYGKIVLRVWAEMVLAMHARSMVGALHPVFAALGDGAWHVQGLHGADPSGEAKPIGAANWTRRGGRFEGADRWGVDGLGHWDRLTLFGRTVQSEPAQAPAPAKGAGGRPSDFDILKISNEIRRVMEIDPDGMPQSSRERRDLVRRACLKVAGREPSDSHLPKIMDLLEIPR